MNRCDLNVKLKLFVLVFFFYLPDELHQEAGTLAKTCGWEGDSIPDILGHLWDILTISLEIFETCTEKFGLLWVWLGSPWIMLITWELTIHEFEIMFLTPSWREELLFCLVWLHFLFSVRLAGWLVEWNTQRRLRIT